jgi:predicted nucleic acid-binding protein
LDVFNVVPVGPSTISSAFPLSLKYGFSYWDSLIVAAALTSGCSTLLSEDMQDGLLIEGKLRIKNPF